MSTNFSLITHTDIYQFFKLYFIRGILASSLLI